MISFFFKKCIFLCGHTKQTKIKLLRVNLKSFNIYEKLSNVLSNLLLKLMVNHAELTVK